mgnify:CR=1 FL=1
MKHSTRLAGKIALVTGGSRGIGAAVAKRLASDGAEIVVAYRRDQAAATDVVKNLTASGAKAHALSFDIARPDDCDALIDSCLKACGRLDVLVNAAGVATYRPLDQVDAAHFHAMFDTNVLGALSLTRAASAAMERGGKIIHFASRLAQTPMANTSVYSASKAAVSAMTLALSQELGPRGITINAIAPGLIETDMTAAALVERGEALKGATPLRRIGQPDDISGIVSFLASEDANWITGRTLRADGGLL